MTYREMLREAKDVPDRERLLLGLKDWSLGAFLLHEDEEADPDTKARFQTGIERLRKHEPLQYVLGKAPFYGRMFRVDEHVLIPRFDTEILVEEALRTIDSFPNDDPGKEVLDLCTGSGCIALTLKLERPALCVTASDLNEDVITVARENEKLLAGEGGCIRWIRSDLFQDVSGAFDLIVTNPPYIRTADIRGLDPEVRDHEPMAALDGGEDGLIFVRRIAREAKSYLKHDAVLLMEIGDEEGKDVLRIFGEEGYEDLKILRDLSGRDRVLRARKG